jgi:hypothetical protein
MDTVTLEKLVLCAHSPPDSLLADYSTNLQATLCYPSSTIEQTGIPHPNFREVPHPARIFAALLDILLVVSISILYSQPAVNVETQ